MNRFITSLYEASPVWLQNLQLSAYGMQLKRLRFGAAHRAELQALRVSEKHGRQALEALQTQRLQAILKVAFHNVPHYRRLAQSARLVAQQIDIHNLSSMLPVLPKHAVRTSPEEFVAENLNPAAITTIQTSGTSGSPLPVVATRVAIQRNYAFFARFLHWHGIASLRHGATFAGRLIIPARQSAPPFWRHNLATDALLCSSYHLSDDWMPSYIQALSRFAPQYIDSYPSAISSLAAFINKTHAPHGIRPKVIITSSETLLDYQRLSIEAAFECKVRDHYGCAEMAAFITECEHGRYHVNCEYGLVEVLRPDGSACAAGEEGDLCCTGFLNDAMPLIRYLIGDRASMASEACSCGRAYPVVARLIGRTDDLIVTPDGRRVGRLDPAFKGDYGLLEAQVIQHAIDSVEVLVVADSRFDALAEAKLRDDLKHRLSQQMNIAFTRVAAIPRERNGKLRAVISRVGK